MSDPYLYPGTSVLKNKLGERNARALHRHLLGDLYDWAGELRTVEMSRGQSAFCLARYIAPQLKELFAGTFAWEIPAHLQRGSPHDR